MNQSMEQFDSAMAELIKALCCASIPRENAIMAKACREIEKEDDEFDDNPDFDEDLDFDEDPDEDMEKSIDFDEIEEV